MSTSRARKTSAHSDPEALLRATKEPDFRQERSRRSYLALIEAAAELFGAHGYDAIGTPEISQRAGVSVGTFYRYFDDKLEIFLEIERRYLARAYHEVMARLTPDRFVAKARRAVIDDALTVLLDHVNRSPTLQRVFLEMALRDERVAALKRAFDDAARPALAALIARIAPRRQVPDPEATAFIIHVAVVECAIAIGGGRGAAPVARDRALAALTELVCRAVGLGEAGIKR